MRAIPVSDLASVVEDPFVAHHVDPALTDRAWVGGRAAVVDTSSGRPGGQRPAFVCVGPPDDLGPLMRAVAGTGAAPRRVSVDLSSYDDLPDAWRHAEHHRWHWMLTTSAPPPPAPHGGVEVVDLDEAWPADRAAVEAVLDRGYPESFARPGIAGLETWLGVRVDGALAAVGALLRMHDGAGHVRAVTVLGEHRGRGVGGVLSHALTERGLSGGNGVVTLGVYTDNAPALRIYERLGYRTRHTFASGPTLAGAAHDAAWAHSASASTSASEPSR